MIGKLQPQAIDIEEAVLGAMLLDRDAANVVVDILTPESFYLESHCMIYGAMMSLFQKHRPIDLMTVTERLKTDGNLETAGGAYYITELTNRVASSAHVESHARIIAEKYILRELIRASAEITKACYDETTDPFDALELAQESTREIAAKLSGQSVTPEISEIVAQRIQLLQNLAKKPNELIGIKTGFQQLDLFTGGWQSSDLIIIAARPSMGKTALMLSLANTASQNGIPVGIASIETSKEKLADRLISTNAEINSHKLKRPATITTGEWSRMTALELRDIYPKDTGSLSVYEFQAWAKLMYQKKGCRMFMVDYMQLMSATRNRGESRELEIARVSRGLKQLAKDLNCPVIALSQLNRGVETRGGDKRPNLSDLRESGSIEQDADFVGFLYRPEYYGFLQNENGESLQGVSELIVAKNRDGDTGTIELRWQAEYMKFLDVQERFSPINQSNGEATPF